MAVDIKGMIAAKHTKKVGNKKLIEKDFNKDLIVALLGISTYGKQARDTEILEVIINCKERQYEPKGVALRREFDQKVTNKEITKSKTAGYWKDKSGSFYLEPRKV